MSRTLEAAEDIKTKDMYYGGSFDSCVKRTAEMMRTYDMVRFHRLPVRLIPEFRDSVEKKVPGATTKIVDRMVYVSRPKAETNGRFELE